MKKLNFNKPQACNQPVTFMITVNLKGKLEKLSRRERVTKSTLVRKILESYFD